MDILYQMALETPQQWTAINANTWRSLLGKGDPLQGHQRVIDAQPGWVNAICCQGVVFGGFDHYAVIDVTEGVEIYGWNDADDGHRGDFCAKVMTFRPLRIDTEYANRVNTDQTTHLYAEGSRFSNLMASHFVDDTHVHPWHEFEIPHPEYIRHGVWLPDGLFDMHEDRCETRTWMEWFDPLLVGRDPRYLGDDGKLVRNPRSRDFYVKPRGTKTYYPMATLFSDFSTAKYDRTVETSASGPGEAADQTSVGASDEALSSWTTQDGEPNSADWPDGDYRYNHNIVSMNKATNYKISLRRVNSIGILMETLGSEDTYTTVGTKSATKSTDPPSGVAADHYQMLIRATADGSHSKATITQTYGNSSYYVDGPWDAGVEGRRRSNVT